MGELQGCFLKAAGIHGIGMVLRGDFDLSCSQILYRMVSSAMTELQLVGLCAIGQSDDLVPQTDAEHGILSAQSTDGINDRLNVVGVARPIGNEHTIGLQGFYGFCRSVPGNYG